MDDLLAWCLLMFMAGLDTVSIQLSYAFWHLAGHPEDRRRLVAEPCGLLGEVTAVELRMLAPEPEQLDIGEAQADGVDPDEELIGARPRDFDRLRPLSADGRCRLRRRSRRVLSSALGRWSCRSCRSSVATGRPAPTAADPRWSPWPWVPLGSRRRPAAASLRTRRSAPSGPCRSDRDADLHPIVFGLAGVQVAAVDRDPLVARHRRFGLAIAPSISATVATIAIRPGSRQSRAAVGTGVAPSFADGGRDGFSIQLRSCVAPHGHDGEDGVERRHRGAR
jgi:hypothetical protein